MPFNINEIDGCPPINHRFPVDVKASSHELAGIEHTGQLVDAQIPAFIMRDDEHQLDPHTMIIDGRDVSIDGDKLDTIEEGAEVNNLTDQQALSLTSGTQCNWHHHDNWYYRKTELLSPGQSQIDWTNIVNTPTTYPATPHIHDDRYYTETEIDTLLNNYSLITHNHDDRYYTETEIDTFLSNYSLTTHNHDDRYYTESELDNGQLNNIYYTETEIDTFLSNYSLTTHNHDDRYYTESELDNGQLNNIYYTETEIDTLLNNYSLITHNHDDRYYTETEIDTFLSNYSLTTHNHDDRYYTESELDNGQLDGRYYTETETDLLIQAASYGISGSVQTYSDLPTPIDDGVIYIVKKTVGSDEEGFYQWSSGSWTFLANNTGTTEHNILPDLNTGDYWHLTSFQYTGLTAGNNTSLHIHDDRYYTETEIDTFLNNYSLITHNHDDRYYTEAEIDTFLSNYSLITHNHDNRYYTEGELNSGQLNNIYYTETEIDNLLNNYSLITHDHDDRYYTETEIDTLLNNYSLTSHTHDDRYYTETEIDNLLNNYSLVTHNHDDRYFTESEIVSNYYSKVNLDGGQLDNRYYTEIEIDTILLGYAALVHNHDNLYYTESEIDTFLNNYSLITHLHDDRYYTENEINSLLAGKANLVHIHDDRYYTEGELSSDSGISGAALIGVSLIGGITSDNVQDALQELRNQLSLTSSTLDEAYDNGGAGLGREITVDSKPVKLNAISTDAPLELTSKTITPTTNLEGGQISVINNILYIYDGDRNKWLSPSKLVVFARNNNSDGSMLSLPGGMRDWRSGIKMLHDACILGVSVETSNSINNKTIDIEINGNFAFSLNTDSNGNILNNSLNYDLNESDYINVYVNNQGPALFDTVFTIELAWRK